MFEWITTIIEAGGYFGIAVLMFLENVFPPIPSELIMPMGGLLAKQGGLSFGPVVVAGTLGSFAGQVLLYHLGRRLGQERLKRWVDDHGHWVAVSCEEIDRAGEWFGRRRGRAAVFMGRLVPGIRSIISIPAGIGKMPLPGFLAFTFLGTAIWTAALTAAGVSLGRNYERVQQYLDPVTYLVIFAIVSSYLWRLAKRHQRDHKPPIER
jgi:membrane protein DedA with SNARE-associated domain